MRELEHIYLDIREEIKHLSFLADLMNNYEDFDICCLQ